MSLSRYSVFALVVATSCGGGGGGGNQAPTGWTVLVYMVADNNLEPFGLYNLKQMAAIGSDQAFRIVTQVDRAASNAPEPVLNLAGWTTAKRLFVKAGSLTEISDLGEVDMADPAVLADFIQWGVKNYPAAHYLLVLWDHGGGWQGFGLDETPFIGATRSTWMTLPKIKTGVANGLQAAGLAKFDIVGFDACLMATLEVAELLKPHANYLLASEETEPGHGWDYRSLAGGAALDSIALSKNIMDGYNAIANSPDWNDGSKITLSLVDLQKLGVIETGIASLASQYGTASAMSPVSAAVGQQRSISLTFGASPDPSQSFNLTDAGDLFGKLAQPLGNAASSIQTAVTSAVVYQVKGSAFSNATGLSIYFPSSSVTYQGTIYDPLPGMDSWRNFLRSFYSARVGVPAFSSGTYNASTSGVTLDGSLTSGSLANITTAFLAYGLPGNGTDGWLFGQAPAQTQNVSGVDHVFHTWDYSFLHLSQTSPAHEEYGYLAIQRTSPTLGVAIIPLHYYQPGRTQPQIAVRELIFDLSSGTVSSDTYYAIAESGQIGPLRPVAGSIIRAVLAHLPNATQWTTQWVEFSSTGGFDATRPISYDFRSLNSGAAFFAGLRIENASGNGNWLATPVNPPPRRP